MFNKFEYRYRIKQFTIFGFARCWAWMPIDVIMTWLLLPPKIAKHVYQWFRRINENSVKNQWMSELTIFCMKQITRKYRQFFYETNVKLFYHSIDNCLLFRTKKSFKITISGPKLRPFDTCFVDISLPKVSVPKNIREVITKCDINLWLNEKLIYDFNRHMILVIEKNLFNYLIIW